MHNLFLGELRHHCIGIWGLKHAKSRSSSQQGEPHTPEQQQKALDRIKNGLRKLSVKTIGRARLDYLEAVVKYNGIEIARANPTRASYAKVLVDWVRTRYCWCFNVSSKCTTGPSCPRGIVDIPQPAYDGPAFCAIPPAYRRA